MSYTARLQFPRFDFATLSPSGVTGAGPVDVLEGVSTGDGPPVYMFTTAVSPAFREVLERWLEEAYERGMRSTGSVGLVADMLHAMETTAAAPDLLLEVPPATTAAAAAEVAAELAELPEGAVF